MYFRKLSDVFVSLFSFYIRFPKAERYIAGLELAHEFVGKNFVDILIDYLTKGLDMKLSDAAKIASVREGLSSILVIFSAHLSDAYLGLFRTIILSNLIYLIGLVLFSAAISVNSIDRKIYLVAIFFLAIGLGGTGFLLQAFLSNQRLLRPSDSTIEKEHARKVAWRPYVVLLLSAAISFVLDSFLPWKYYPFVTIAVVFAGLLCFVMGNSLYEPKPPTGGPLTTAFCVFKAAILRKCRTTRNKFYKIEEPDNLSLPTTTRWLDKAAILESTSISKQGEKRWPETDGRLYTIAEEVIEVKRLLKMIPMWTLLLVYSVVGAAGNTFFLEQSSSMNDAFPLIAFLILMDLVSLVTSDMARILLPKFRFLKAPQLLAILVQIGIGMMCSFICCIVAWKVENFRLYKQMSVLWLTPQFVLLGCMKGFAEDGIDEFFKTQFSGSIRNYGPAFNQFILGIGKFMSAILLVIFKGWFGKDVDSSHLESYYELLAWLSLLNFFLFVASAVWYGTNQHVEIERLSPTSIKTRSFPPQRRPLPESPSFHSRRPTRSMTFNC